MFKENFGPNMTQYTATTAITAQNTNRVMDNRNAYGNNHSDKGGVFNANMNSTYAARTNNETVMNYPYAFDNDSPSFVQSDVDFQDKLKFMNNTAQRLKVSQQMSNAYTIEDGFNEKLSLAQAFVDMMAAEGILEKKRRDLALRSDFNLVDAFKLFNSVKNHKRGIDCDDFYYVLRDILGLSITHDEVFIIFYKLDRDNDSFISYTELTQAFIPKQHEYAVLIQSRKPYFGEHTSPKAYFEGDTKEFLKKHLKGMIDCEVSIELVK